MTPRSSTSVDPVTRYADLVASGKVMAGPYVRAACERHFRDLRYGKERGLTWRPDIAERVFGYHRDVLRLNGGQFEGKPFELELWQKFIDGSLFGWLGPDGFRRFRVAYVEIAKGNGKSPMAAGVGLYGMTSDNEPRAEVYAAASKRDQALILFRDAVAMVQQSPALKERLIVVGGVNPYEIKHPTSGSWFKAIASEDGQSGPRPHIGLCDEVHEHLDGTVIGMMRAGTKGRRQALLFEITNSGYDRTSICWDHHDYSTRVVQGVIEDDSWFGYVCALDEGDDWRDETVWRKANPNLGVSITEKYLREQVREASGMPSKQSLVQRLNFCQWVDSESPWIDLDAWTAVEAEFSIADLKGRPCYAALDLSSKNDLTAFLLFFPFTEDGQDRIDVVARFWTPQQGLAEREQRDKVPYTVWVERGYIEATPGRTVDYSFVAQALRDTRETYDLRGVAFDRWRINDLIRELDALGLSTELGKMDGEYVGSADVVLFEHGQGYKDMSPAVEALESRVLAKRIRILKNPVMTMCAANAVVSTDPAGSRKFDKRPGRSTGRIDGVVACAMGTRLVELRSEVDFSVYETRGFATL